MWTLFGMTPKMRKNPSCAKLKRKLQENKTPLYPPHKQKRKNPSLIKYFNFFFLSLNLENLAFFSQRRDSLLQFPKASRTIWQNDPPCISPHPNNPTIRQRDCNKNHHHHHTNFLISIHSVEKSSNTNFCTTSFSPWYKKKSWQSFEKHFWKISRKVSYYDILILSFSRSRQEHCYQSS